MGSLSLYLSTQSPLYLPPRSPSGAAIATNGPLRARIGSNCVLAQACMLAHATPRAAQLSLDDMIKKSGPGKGKGGGRGAGGGGRGAGAGRGGAIKRGGVARSARQSAAPYKKPAKGGGSTLSSMASNSRTNAATKNAALKQSGGLTTGGSAKIKVANLDTGVTSGDIKELFGEIGNVKSAEIVTNQAGASKGGAACTEGHPPLARPARFALGCPPRPARCRSGAEERLRRAPLCLPHDRQCHRPDPDPYP